MKDHGTLVFKTYKNERRMHYIIEDEKILLYTDPKTKKVSEIKENPVVTTNLNDKKYIATLITDPKEVSAIKKRVEIANMKGLQKYFAKIFNRKKKEFIAIQLDEK